MIGSKIARVGLIAGASFGLVTASTASSQGLPYPEGCGQVAWSICSYDENGRPIEVTYECWEYEYQRCIDNWGGGAGESLAYKFD